MRSLYFSAPPVDVEVKKASRPQNTTIMGVGVYISAVLPALLRYGTFDKYYLPEVPWKDRERALAVPEIAANVERIFFLPEHRLPTMCESETLVLMNPGASLRLLANLRSRLRRDDAPITAVLHSLNYNDFIEELLLEILSPANSFDAYFASSSAGLAAMRKRVEFVQDRARKTLGLDLAFRPQVLTLPLGIDAEGFLPKDSTTKARACVEFQILADAIVILYLGRFSSVSKADLYPLIIAFSTLPYQSHQMLLVLAGDDTLFHLSDDLQRFAQDLGCAEHVRVIPDISRDQKFKLYELADIFVSPSDSTQETFGITLVEAMAASLPVIASDWDGYKDIVRHNETGYLIPTILPDHYPEFDLLQTSGRMASDDLLARTTVVSIRHLRDAMLALGTDANLRRRLGLAGRRRALEHYDWKNVIGLYEEAWDHLAQQGRARLTSMGSRQLEYSDVYSYRQVFGHYATSILCQDDHLQLAPLARSASQRQSIVSAMAQPSDRFDHDLFVEILGIVPPDQPIAVGDLMERISQSETKAGSEVPDEQAAVYIHLMRLLKYGLIEVLPQQKTESR